MHNGKWHAGAVESGGMQSLANVLRQIVTAQHGLLLPKASFTRSNGNVSFIDCTPVRALKASVSSESIDMPEYQPFTES